VTLWPYLRSDRLYKEGQISDSKIVVQSDYYKICEAWKNEGYNVIGKLHNSESKNFHNATAKLLQMVKVFPPDNIPIIQNNPFQKRPDNLDL